MPPKQHAAHIRIVVEKVHVEGRGAILLTGPSSCGKGKIAESICAFLSLPPQQHVSMGDVLRQTVQRANRDANFRQLLGAEYDIDDRVSIFDAAHNSPDVMEKARRYTAELEAAIPAPKAHQPSQLDWLAFCLAHGLLIPDDWAEAVIDAHFAQSPHLREGLFILDGYPRTEVAAEKLLTAFDRQGIGVIKVLHLSITKDEMKQRAQGRHRSDDTEAALDSRYQFYIEKVQPCIDYLKIQLGPDKVALIDAHQPVFDERGDLDVEQSIRAVTISVLEALGLPQYLLDLKTPAGSADTH